jgi:hypothetical protein
VVFTGLTGVGQWTRGLVFRCILRSEGCVLVLRSSGTQVATWAWPTWVVSRRRVLEAVFILLEFPSPSRRIFIGLYSLPPSLVRRIGPSKVQHLRRQVTTFTQGEEEGIDQAWNRFNKLIEQGPRLGFSGDVLLHTFFFSLTPSCMQHVQMCAGGDLMEKTLTEAAQLLQKN